MIIPAHPELVLNTPESALHYKEAVIYSAKNETVRFYDEPREYPVIPACCIVPITRINDKYFLLFGIRANGTNGSGFSAYPGGLYDKNHDGAFSKLTYKTGLREIFEEWGIGPQHLMLMTHVRPPLPFQITAAGLRVLPLFAYMNTLALNEIKLCKKEVESVGAIPATFFYDDRNMIKDVILPLGSKRTGFRYYKSERFLFNGPDLKGISRTFDIVGPSASIIHDIRSRLPTLEHLVLAGDMAAETFAKGFHSSETHRMLWKNFVLRTESLQKERY